MIFKVELSEQAEQDLRSIYEYIFYTLKRELKKKR